MENAMDKKYFCKENMWESQGKRHNRSKIVIFTNAEVTRNAICGVDIYHATQYNDIDRKTERAGEVPEIACATGGELVVSA